MVAQQLQALGDAVTGESTRRKAERVRLQAAGAAATAKAMVPLAGEVCDDLSGPPLLSPKWFGITLGAIGGIVLIILLGLIPGWTQSAYEWLWTNTTGQPWTNVMQEQPWWLPIFAFPLVGLLAAYLPFQWWARALLVSILAAVGYIAGHVFW